MDSILEIFSDASSTVFISLFFKAFAVLFSFMFLLYAIVITSQTQEMNHTVTTENAPTIFTIALLHIGLALILIFSAFMFI